LNKFDDELIEQLQELKKAHAVLHFPFFANTFPLAFHYAKTTEEADFDAKILEQDWKRSMPVLEGEHLHVFYATKKAIESGGGPNTRFLIVSQYRPRLIFADYRPFLHAEVKAQRKGEIVDLDRDDDPSKNTARDMERKESQMFPGALLPLAKDLGVVNFELFTDVPDQARLIREKTDLPTEIIAEGIDGLKTPKLAKRTLRLHFFGAPASTRMIRDPFKYIPFIVEDGLLENDDTMLTCVCVSDQRGNEIGPEVPKILNGLAEYHKKIFKAAQQAKDSAMEFHEICLAYNRLAERKQDSTVFTNPAEFAACLRTHHKDPDGTPT
jgi:hypothetical protein